MNHCPRCDRDYPGRGWLNNIDGQSCLLCPSCDSEVAPGAKLGNDRLQIGKAGEFWVASQLLRLGFNADVLPVDRGVDVMAHRFLVEYRNQPEAANELYQFQVKTTSTDESRVPLPVERIREFWERGINLIVVFWPLDQTQTPAAIILPPSLFYMLTSGGFEDPRAPIVTTGDVVSLRFIRDGARFLIRNHDHDVTPMANRFDRVEPVGSYVGTMPHYAYWGEDNALVAFDPD